MGKCLFFDADGTILDIVKEHQKIQNLHFNS